MSARGPLRPPQDLVQALKRAGSVALFTHLNPDGDGLGSQAALAQALAGMGKRVAVLNADATPRQYAFLGLDRFSAPPPAAGNGQAERTDLAVSLDCPVLERLGQSAAAFRSAGHRAVIDHHVAKQSFGDLEWIEEKAAATGEMMEPLILELGAPLTPAIATALYAAVVNDTGCFRHSNTDQRVFELAARLLQAGADSRLVNRQLMDTRPLAAIRLCAKALSGLKTLEQGQGAMVSVSQADLAEFGATWEETDGLAETLRSIEGVEVSAMLREEGPAKVKVSLRSKARVDVNALAMGFGGGGHARAAGATLSCSLKDAQRELEAALREALRAA